jgi:hypothetical protein
MSLSYLELPLDLVTVRVMQYRYSKTGPEVNSTFALSSCNRHLQHKDMILYPD